MSPMGNKIILFLNGKRLANRIKAANANTEKRNEGNLHKKTADSYEWLKFTNKAVKKNCIGAYVLTRETLIPPISLLINEKISNNPQLF